MPTLSPSQSSALSPQPATRRILLVAGEASGDAHGADVVSALRDRAAQLEVFGVGGQALRAAGMRTLVDSAAIAGMGLFEASDKVGNLIRAYRQLSALLRSQPPDLLVLIDFPEFNLRIAKIAKQAGVPVFYTSAPRYGRGADGGSTPLPNGSISWPWCSPLSRTFTPPTAVA